MSKPKKPKKGRPVHPPVVYIEWHDARRLSSSGWTDRAEVLTDAKRLYAERVVAVGFLLELNDEYAVLAASYAPNDDVGESLLIPVSEIRVNRTLRPQRGGGWEKKKT